MEHVLLPAGSSCHSTAHSTGHSTCCLLLFLCLQLVRPLEDTEFRINHLGIREGSTPPCQEAKSAAVPELSRLVQRPDQKATTLSRARRHGKLFNRSCFPAVNLRPWLRVSIQLLLLVGAAEGGRYMAVCRACLLVSYCLFLSYCPFFSLLSFPSLPSCWMTSVQATRP